MQVLEEISGWLDSDAAALPDTAQQETQGYREARGRHHDCDGCCSCKRRVHSQSARCARVLPVMIDADCVVSQQRLTAFH